MLIWVEGEETVFHGKNGWSGGIYKDGYIQGLVSFLCDDRVCIRTEISFI